EHLLQLTEALRIPQIIRTNDRHVSTGLEGLCICLRRLVYPNRLTDLEPLFGLSAKHLSDIANTVVRHIYLHFHHPLTNLRNLPWLNYNKLQQYSQAIADKNAPLRNCWEFIDGTARPICRPSHRQQNFFSGHKRVHCLKYQSVVVPDGIIYYCSLMGPYEGRRHDVGIFRDSNLYTQLEQNCRFPNNENFVLYGDPAYAKTYCSTTRINTRMNTVRQAVEWEFRKIVSEFAFLDFKKNQKLLLQNLDEMYISATILTNCHTCLYGSQASQYFNVVPPTLQQYLH
ncbi:hypothetical protein NQ315_013416, partial [Exocentrus adspersus]